MVKLGGINPLGNLDTAQTQAARRSSSELAPPTTGEGGRGAAESDEEVIHIDIYGVDSSRCAVRRPSCVESEQKTAVSDDAFRSGFAMFSFW